MPIVGIEKLYVAIQTKDNLTGLTYNPPKYYDGVKTLLIKPKQNTEKLYAENMLWDQATTLDSVDIEADLADLSSAQRVELLGQTNAAVGGVYDFRIRYRTLCSITLQGNPARGREKIRGNL